MNTALFRFINDAIKNPFLDAVLPAFSDKNYVVIPGLVLLVLVICFGGRRARTCMLALVLALLCADRGLENVVKNIFAEKRPYAALEGVHLYRGNQWIEYDPAQYARDPRQSNSFPSSHTSNVAAIVVVLAVLRRRTLWATIPLALLVGLSRIYTGNHYPLDVLGGYFWGGGCAAVLTAASLWIVRRVWGEEPAPKPALPWPRDRKDFVWLLGLWTFVNFGFIYMNPFCLAGDEAQYWDWSRHLALGYYSKPPLIAYLIRILTGAAGHKEWAIRSGAVLFTSGAVALTYALTLRIAQRERTALIAACVALAMPATWAGSVLMTIDPPMIFFWVLAMYAFHRAVNGEPAMWWLTGLALGLGMLAKYTVLVLVISFALYLLLADRRPLRTFGPYAALLIMLACMSGVIYWNAAHDWVSIRHTASIGVSGANSIGKTFRHFGEYFAGQAGLVSPILFGLFAWTMGVLARRFKTNRDAAFLFLCSIVLFGFYAVVALTRAPQANWPVCAYLAAVPAFAWVWTERARGQRMQRLLAVAVVLGCVLGIGARASNLVYLANALITRGAPPADRVKLGAFSFDPDRDPTNKLLGGRELGTALSNYIGVDKATAPFIFSNRYQLTAWAAFYTQGRPHTYYANPEDRYNQYDLWGGWDKLVGRDALFVVGGDAGKGPACINLMTRIGAFERGEYLETVPVYRGNTVIKTFAICKLYNYSGYDWRKTTEKF